MTERELLEQAAERYRRNGYEVIVNPSGTDLPTFLANAELDLIARKGKDRVAVQVKKRDELHDIGPIVERVNAEPGWSYDLVLSPRPSDDDPPADATEPGVDYIESLLAETDRLLGAEGVRGAFLIAWSAAEAAMRESARREGIQVNGDPPRSVAESLCTYGVVSQEDYRRVKSCLATRAALAHGMRPSKLEADDIRFLTEFARHLLSGEPAPAE